MNLGKKLMLGFLIPVLMLLSAGFWSYHRFNSLSHRVDAMLVENDRSIQAASHMTEALERLDSASLLQLVGEQKEANEIHRDGELLFQESLAIAEGNITIEGEIQIIDSLRTTYENYLSLLNHFQQAPNFVEYKSQINPAFLTVKHQVTRLRTINSDVMYERALYIGRQAYRATLPGMILMIGAVLFTLMFAWLIREHSVKPLRKLLKATDQWLVHGQYRHPEITTGDEIEELANTLESVSNSLKKERES